MKGEANAEDKGINSTNSRSNFVSVIPKGEKF
jgi:hypothetical protein